MGLGLGDKDLKMLTHSTVNEMKLVGTLCVVSTEFSGAAEGRTVSSGVKRWEGRRRRGERLMWTVRN